uniref:Uncharacterized protein n=1 Tax=Melopsittacus undulatus TaxID=13146 RepID=A0A8C6IZF7_MELUD
QGRDNPPPPGLTSSRPPSCPCSPWRPARPASPWRCGWPRCWGPRRAGSPARSAGTRGPASRHSHPPPRCPWLCCCPLLLPPPGQTLFERESGAICSSSVMLLRSGSPARKASSESAQPNSCSGSSNGAAPLGPASAHSRPPHPHRSPAPAPGLHWGPPQTRSHWRRGPAWHHPLQPGWGS